MTERAEIERLLTQLQAEHIEVAEHLKRLTVRDQGLRQAVAGLTALLMALEDNSSGNVSQDPPGQTPPSSEASGEKAPEEEAPEGPQGQYPRGAEAVRLVLMDANAELNVREITAALMERGWAPHSKNPENATSSNAARAVEVYPDVVRRRADNGSLVYRYLAQDESGVTRVSDQVTRALASDLRSVVGLGPVMPSSGVPAEVPPGPKEPPPVETDVPSRRSHFVRREGVTP